MQYPPTKMNPPAQTCSKVIVMFILDYKCTIVQFYYCQQYEYTSSFIFNWVHGYTIRIGLPCQNGVYEMVEIHGISSLVARSWIHVHLSDG